MYDYIIVGQGIAGTVLSYTFLKEGKKILVIDKGNEYSCSSVAAGLFNPVTGKRMVRTWNASKIFPFFPSFYQQLGKDIGTTIFNPLPIYRPFGTIEEQNHWLSHSEEETFVKSKPAHEEGLSNYIQNTFGGFETNFSGWVNVKEMLLGMKNLLKQNDSFIEESFDFEQFHSNESFVTWKDKKARRIVFCEGYLANNNPYFNWIKYSPSKGEIIIVKIPNFPEDVIVNKNLFIVPIGNSIFKIGATFERTTENLITQKGRDELIERLGNLIKLPFEVIDQQSGIRPSVPDRRPLIGLHPEDPKLALFNGMGTKGISLSPYFANQFFNFLENGQDLDPAVNIQRFYSLYFRS